MTTDSGRPASEDEPAREGIEDTWGWKQDAASWVAEVHSPGGDAATVNRWWADLVAGLLDDFTPLARVRSAMLLTDEGPTRIARRDGEPYARFRDRLLEAIRNSPSPLKNVELELDLHVWFRIAESPDRPVLGWLSYPGIKLDIYVDPEDRRGWAAFELTHTLFSPVTYPDRDDNRELYALNQPLLADALGRWRRRAGVPLGREGELPGIREGGFSSDLDDY